MPREMFLVGSLVVLCGLLAQSTAQLAGLPYPLYPLGQDLPMSMGHCRSLHVGQTLPYYGVTPIVSTYPSEHLARNFGNGNPCERSPPQIHKGVFTNRLGTTALELADMTPEILCFVAFRRGLLSRGVLSFLEHMPLLNYVRPAGSNAGGLVGALGKVISSIPILNNILE